MSITRLSGPHNPELVALLLDRAAFLPTYDRALIEAIFRQRRTAAGVAAVFNVPASTMRRRILSIACRCFSPSYAFVAQCRDTWPPTTRRVATALVLGGLPMREASLQLGLTLHVTRIHRDVILTMVSTATSLGAVDPAAALARRSCA
ncbi:MAG: hypothetical protein H7Y88_01105 [Phycisphaerales bacterium]|nr:hypothetical protein [Phycisphaerales bacterium]